MVSNADGDMVLCFNVEHAFPDEEQTKTFGDHDTVSRNMLFLAVYCCEIPNGQAGKLVWSSVVIYLQVQRRNTCNSNGCVITLLIMYLCSRYEQFL